MTPTLRLNLVTIASSLLAVALVLTLNPQDAAAQATIRSRDLSEAWSAAPSLLPSASSTPSWNAQPNSWRLGVAIQNVDTGVVLTDVEAGMPAQQAGLETGDIIVNVGGFQVGYVKGALFDLGDFFSAPLPGFSGVPRREHPFPCQVTHHPVEGADAEQFKQSRQHAQ